MRTVRGALVRADSLSRLSAEGWQALLDHGVRTVLDLRNEREREQAPDFATRPPEIETVAVAIDGTEDAEFWRPIAATPEFGTPLYYRAHLVRKPQLDRGRRAGDRPRRPGGVAFHCVGGRDRSGQVDDGRARAGRASTPRAIAADYELSHERLAGLWAALGEEDQAPELIAYLAERGTSAGEVIETTLASLDLEATLSAGGLTGEDLAALRGGARAA